LAGICRYTNIFVFDRNAESIYFHDLGNAPLFLSVVSTELVYEHWVSGLLIFAGVIYSMIKIWRKDSFIFFNILMFLTICLVTGLIGKSLFDSHWRASLTIYPGLILLANMLIEQSRKRKHIVFLNTILIIYFAAHSFYFITYPRLLFVK